MAAAAVARQNRPRRDFRGGVVGRHDGAGAMESAAQARCRGANAFHRADRLVGADRLRSRAGTDRVDPRAGVVRPGAPSGDCWRARAAGDRTAVAGAQAGTDHARSAGLLAWQLRGCENRTARPLPATSLAGRSGQCTGHPPGQAARGITIFALNLSLTMRGGSLNRVKAILALASETRSNAPGLIMIRMFLIVACAVLI